MSEVNRRNRLGWRWLNYLKAIFGHASQRRLAYAALQVDRIRYWESAFSKLSDEETKDHVQQLRSRVHGGESLNGILPEIFGLVCVASVRIANLRPFDVQLSAGVVLHHGALIELAAGEGKRLVTTLPVALNALSGKGVHVVSSNNWFARRDAQWAARIYNALGLRVGVIQTKMPDEERARAYRCDITYAPASELAFDLLRDRLKVADNRGQALPMSALSTKRIQDSRFLGPTVQRDLQYVLVNEAEKTLIDDARMPLLIAGPTRPASEPEQVIYKWADRLGEEMERNIHFTLDEETQKVELTEEGCRKIHDSNPPAGQPSHVMDKLFKYVEQAIHAHHRLHCGYQYMVEGESIVILDECTSRRMPERHWREGLRQAVEAKERMPITIDNEHAAALFFPRYFRLYKKLAGVTGSRVEDSRQLRTLYRLCVVRVPTNQP